ncbi:MAG: hypothetical protein AB1589_38160, partial [Cyanobacteriota bacterium]
LTAIYCQRRQSEPYGKLLEEIDSFSLFDGDIKDRLKATVTDGCGCSTVMNSHTTDVTQEVIAMLENVPGMTKAHHRDFKSSNPIVRLRDGTAVRTWKNPLGVDHVFLADANNQIVYGGYVGWIHSERLNAAIARIKRDFT